MEYSDFKIHHLDGYIQSLYIVEYADKLLLLDGGSRGDVMKIEYFITRTLKRPMSDLKLIVVTHLHPDHAGAAPHLRKKFNIPIAGHPELDYWYKGFSGQIQHLLDTLFAWFVAYKLRNKYKRVWFQPSLKPDYELCDDQMLPFFYDWEVLCTPGHTTHDISVLNRKERIIYIGDLAIKLGSKFNLPFPVALPSVMEKSLIRVSELDVDNILFAHGGVVNESSEVVFDIVRSKLKNYPPPKFKRVKWFTNLNRAIRKYYN
ncbi:MAG: MBL fold metallo-hydrolase [Flavobacteriales bacterium]|nr:MBL fold metallo-hydrolase [Flavobacteriales bacterium]